MSVNVISGFRRGINETFRSSGMLRSVYLCSATFWDKGQISSWITWPFNMGRIGCPETSLTSMRCLWFQKSEVSLKFGFLFIKPFHGATAPSGSGPHYQGFMITLRHTAVGRTPLDGWSARRRDLYLTTHNTHNRQTTDMLPVRFEPTIPASERPQTHALDRVTSGTCT
jgi:hypothetical protein